MAGTKTTERVKWIDGIRAIASLCVVLHHVALQYYPATYYGSAADVRAPFGLDYYFSGTPFLFVLNGNFWVCVFLVLTGYMAGKKSKNLSGSKACSYLRYVVKRYLTLLLPIFVATALLYVGSLMLPGIIVPGGGSDIPLSVFIKNALGRSFFFCDRSVIGMFWTMQSTFLGGLIVAFSAVSFEKKRLRIGLLLVLIVLFATARRDDPTYFVPVLCGGLLREIEPYFSGRYSALCGGCLLLAGTFLAAYPSGSIPSGVYALIPTFPRIIFTCHVLAAILFLCGISVLPKVQNVLSGKILQRLGKISYLIYVFHCFALDLSRLLFYRFDRIIGSYSVTVVLVTIVCSCVLLVGCELYRRILDEPWKKLISKI